MKALNIGIATVSLIFVLSLLSCSTTTNSKKEAIGLFPIIQNGRWGYIDKTGQLVINPQFDLLNLLRDKRVKG